MSSKTRMATKKLLISVYTAVVLILVIVSIGYYRIEMHRIKEEKVKDLQEIANVTVKNILQWQQERIHSAAINSHSPLLIKSIVSWYNDKQSRAKSESIMNILQLAKERFRLKDIALYSLEGKRIFSTNQGAEENTEQINYTIDSSIISGRITCTGFYFSNSYDQIHYDIVAPVYGADSQFISCVHYCIDINDFLNSFNRNKVNERSSLETLIVCKIDSMAFYVNGISNTNDGHEADCIQIKNSDQIGLFARNGSDGIHEGTDNRGEKVLAYIHKLPGTNLMIIIKEPNHNLYTNLNYRIGVILLFILFLLLFIGFGMAYIYSNQQKNLYKALFIKERDLSETLGEFRTTLYSIADAVICTDSKGQIKQMNRMSESLTEWSELEAENRPLDNILRIIDENTRIPIDILSTGISKNDVSHKIISCLLLSKNGREIPILGSIAPIYDNSESYLGLVIVFRDQTKERLAQKTLKESEEKYRILFEKSAEAIFLLEKGTGKYLDANSAAEKLTGRSIDELRNLDTSIITPNGFKERLDALNLQTINQEFGEVEYIRPDGSIRIALLSTVTLDNNIIYGIARDITDRKLSELELIKAKNKAEESDRLKTAFLNNVSHEIRTPMNAIVGFANLLSKENIQPNEIKRFTNIVIDNSHQLELIISDIIAIASLEAGQTKTVKSSVNINSLMKSAYNQFESIARSKNISFTLELTEDLQFDIITDELKVKQILINLLSNAFKFTLTGSVRFGYVVNKESIEFYVKDTGIGIDENMHEEIFKRFTQVRMKDGKLYGGNGLGLSISKAYVELLNGRIWLDSEPKKGSTFFFSLPIRKNM